MPYSFGITNLTLWYAVPVGATDLFDRRTTERIKTSNDLEYRALTASGENKFCINATTLLADAYNTDFTVYNSITTMEILLINYRHEI